MNKIERNDEEQSAFEALADAINDLPEDAQLLEIAELVEHRLLEMGYTITRIDPINI